VYENKEVETRGTEWETRWYNVNSRQATVGYKGPTRQQKGLLLSGYKAIHLDCY
jgi:hypothetical protein